MQLSHGDGLNDLHRDLTISCIVTFRICSAPSMLTAAPASTRDLAREARLAVETRESAMEDAAGDEKVSICGAVGSELLNWLSKSGQY